MGSVSGMVLWLLAFAGQVVGEGPGWRAVAWPVKRAVAPVIENEHRVSLLQERSLSPEGSDPALQVLPGQWYRYHSITTNINYYTNIPLWIATRFQISLAPGENLPLWVDSIEVYFVAENQDPNLTDTIFIWNGTTTQPTTLIDAFPFNVPTGPGVQGWRLVVYFDDPYPIQQTLFWLGYRSLATPSDTVWVAAEACSNCANPATRNVFSFDNVNWIGPFTRDWGVGLYGRKSHAVDEGVWSFVFPNWPFITTQLDGDTLAVVHRNWGGNNLTTMGGRLVVTFRGSSDTTVYTLTAGPYAPTVQDTFRQSMASYVGQGYEGVITFEAWSEQSGDQDLSNDTLRFSDYVFPNYTTWAQGFEFDLTGWAAYDLDGNGETWAVYAPTGHTGYRAAGDTARAGENNVLVGPAWTLGGTAGDATYGNVLAGFINIPAGVSVTLTVQALSGPDPGTATVLWQNSHTLTGLLKAGWVKIQDTLDPALNGSTIYPAWRLSTTSATPSLILLDNLYGQSAPMALDVEESVRSESVRLVMKGPRELRVLGGPVRKVLVVDPLGRRILRAGPETKRLVLRGLPAGVYTLIVEGTHRTQRFRVVLP